MTVKEDETRMEVPEKSSQPTTTGIQARGKGETKQKEHDIVAILRSSGHRVHSCSSGITLGVRLEAVPGTHGVNVGVTHVVDLRSDSLWKTSTAMKGAVLGCVTRPLESILEEVGLQESLKERMLVTPWGRIRLPMLVAPSGKTSSVILETRFVYVIHKDVRPSADLSWLTDTRRILSINDLAFTCQSDTRSSAAKLRDGIAANKVSLIRQAVAKGWYGVLALITSLAGLATGLTIGLAHPGAMVSPLAVAGLGGTVAAGLLLTSKKGYNELVRKLESDNLCLSSIGDSVRVSKSATENGDLLRLLGDLSFTVSPLMVAAAEALKAREVDAAVSSACLVLDECVRLAPGSGDTSDPVFGVTDEGLSRFLGLMKHLGFDSEDANLALAYVGLTGHLSSPIGFSEVVGHMTLLNNTLYDVGVLGPDVKEKLDSVMNTWAMKTVAHRLEEDLQAPEEVGPVLPSTDLKTEGREEVRQATTDGRRKDREEESRQYLGNMRSSQVTPVESTPVEEANELTAAPMQESLEDLGSRESTGRDMRDPPRTAADVVRIVNRRKAEPVLALHGRQASGHPMAGQLVDGQASGGDENDDTSDV